MLHKKLKKKQVENTAKQPNKMHSKRVKNNVENEEEKELILNLIE